MDGRREGRENREEVPAREALGAEGPPGCLGAKARLPAPTPTATSPFKDWGYQKMRELCAVNLCFRHLDVHLRQGSYDKLAHVEPFGVAQSHLESLGVIITIGPQGPQ